MKFYKWLIPGLKIKRWFFLHFFSVVILIISTIIILKRQNLSSLSFFSVSLAIYIYTLRLLYKRFANIHKIENKNIFEKLYKEKKLSRGPKIVAIGGGTGLSTLLSGLKQFTNNITAIVTVSDDGGSSGILREYYDVLPPGDIRNCLVALADSENLMQKLFQYRFPEEKPLSGHTVGNLVILALRNILGDFETALKETSKILAIKGKVIPASFTKIKLIAKNTDGSYTEGEQKITKSVNKIEKITISPENASASKEAIDAISNCDAIVIGPGSLYTSVIPNLLIKGIRDAIIKASCRKIYVCNVMTQEGETDKYTAYDHIKAIERHCNAKVFETVIVNKSSINKEALLKYRMENSYPVEIDEDKIKKEGYKIIKADIINSENMVRHNSYKLAKIICEEIIEKRK